MTLDADDLELLRQISNYRQFLRDPRSPLVLKEFGTLRNTTRRINVATAELRVLEARWIDRGLVRAGLCAAVDPNTQPLPAMYESNPGRFVPPDPVLVDECDTKAIAAALKTTPENVCVLFAIGGEPA